MFRENPRPALRRAIILAALGGAFLLLFVAPNLAKMARAVYPEAAYMYWPGLAYVWLIGLLWYLGLWQFWKIVAGIGRENAFSAEHARHLAAIRRIILAIGALLIGGIAALCALDLAQPGFLLLLAIGVATCAILAVAIAAASKRSVFGAGKPSSKCS